MTLFDGITALSVPTPRLRVNVLSRTAQPTDAAAVVFVHGRTSSAAFWQQILLGMPDDFAAYAIDLRGFGGTEAVPIDRSKGVRDFSDDLHAASEALGLGDVHLVGWDLGGSVVLQYAIDHPVLSVTLQAPVASAGIAGTHLDVSGIVDLDVKPPILWVRGSVAHLAAIADTRAMLDRYAATGGRYEEHVFEGAGDSPHLEQPQRFLALLADHVRRAS